MTEISMTTTRSNLWSSLLVPNELYSEIKSFLSERDYWKFLIGGNRVFAGSGSPLERFASMIHYRKDFSIVTKRRNSLEN
jgi:hypothetical protein